MTDTTTPAPETIAATHGVASDTAFGAVSPPLYLSSTYAFEGYERAGRYDYGRSGNPTRDMLGEALAALEGGAGAVVTATGMAAVDLLLGLFGPDDLIVAPHDCYGGTYRLLAARAAKRQFRLTFVDQSDEAAFAAALADRPALVLVETPSNPLMRVVDVRVIAAKAHAAGASVAVDNTFLSPAAQRPLTLGADYVIHSTTKFINGHSDVIGGAVVAADAGEVDRLKRWANTVGATGSPFDAWLTLRGLRTLFARMERQQRNAQIVAEWLAGRPEVAAVHYPGLASHPGHAVARAQQTGFGAMLSFDLAGGAPAVAKLVEAVGTFTLAESLGGVESLIAHPATMTHADMGEEARRVAGIGEGLVRLSIGLEHPDDLIAGLAQGFAAIR
ncbi:MAG TPA: cystathionine gamma-synthase [Sphingomonas sp.]|nr:cystathionine gamma-synthase [Sphingomonas sp.]